MKTKILILFLVMIALWSCERDDICSEDTVATPHLVIQFTASAAENPPKVVRKLTVVGEGSETPIVYRTTTDKISLPLRFQEEGILTTTRFVLTKDDDYTDNGDDDPDTNPNSDTIEVSYTPQFVYISRACGYKSIFNGTSMAVEPDDDNWILSFQIINATIDTETDAQIILRH